MASRLARVMWQRSIWKICSQRSITLPLGSDRRAGSGNPSRTPIDPVGLRVSLTRSLPVVPQEIRHGHDPAGDQV